MDIPVSIKIGDIDFEALEADDDFEGLAQSLLPTALEQMREAAGEVAWNEIQRAFTGAALQVGHTGTAKRQFVADAARQFRQSATTDDKREVADTIVTQLREQKARQTDAQLN